LYFVGILAFKLYKSPTPTQWLPQLRKVRPQLGLRICQTSDIRLSQREEQLSLLWYASQIASRASELVADKY
jgi:hypothetical protein